ncbi:hypothetical protein Pcinc_002199, partial [Petrolisthes cinctipes]
IMVLHRVCVVAALLMSVEQVSVLKTEGKVETVMEKMVERVVEHYLKGCHLVFLTTTTNSPLASSIISLLERIGLYKRSECGGGCCGFEGRRKEGLLHPAYVTLPTPSTSPSHLTQRPSQSSHLAPLPPQPPHLTPQARGQAGRRMEVVCLCIVVVCTVITGKQRYTIHEEPQRTWGAEKDGVFGGMMGQLQREESDMCTASGTTPNRFKVIDYARIYPSDIMTVTSLQPSLLPQYLALVTPFSDGVWLSLLVGVVGWSVAMWALQLVWTRMVAEGGRGISFSMALMYGWGALLEQTHPDPSLSVSGQLLVGWWLVFCVVITTGYRSSLVAHLTVQGKTAPIDTLEDMVALQGWRWGTEESLYKGAVVEYFTKHQDPVVQKTHSVLEVLGWEEGLRKVQEGDYSFLAFRDFIRFIVGSRYTDANGRSPFFISKKGISVLPFLGWWFRDGAPLYHRFKELLNRLESAGVRGYWTEQVLEKRIKESREAILRDSQDSRPRLILGDERHETLKLGHMQGAFYLLCLGLAVAFHVLILELIVPPPQTPTASL